MTLIAVTMLRLYDASRDEWRDAIDQRWTAFLGQCALLPLYMPNDPQVSQELLERFHPDGVLLTGGGSCQALTGSADCRDETEALLLTWAQQRRLPVLGVCRGMQVMLARAGARLEPVTAHVGAHDIRYRGTTRRVNSFHDYGFYAAPPGYEVEAVSEDGVIEAVSHPGARHSAVMWHPERNPQIDSADLSLVRQVFGVSA
ncbi:gamma-glutamyl-gamma-aminobutyrate hydrolase family protein [Pseudomonas sp. NPDC087346]|uniref:gamma-glutamyl-gamma-aminobutyrate hydrolase family protein n=1 Tax=Pseudomonas sp. NPDC087346 TaxID=3364438 RepID=UPI00382278AE